MFEFEFTIELGHATMLMTSVLGHLFALDFPPAFATWPKVAPLELFTADIISSVSKVDLPTTRRKWKALPETLKMRAKAQPF